MVPEPTEYDKKELSKEELLHTEQLNLFRLMLFKEKKKRSAESAEDTQHAAKKAVSSTSYQVH